VAGKLDFHGERSALWLGGLKLSHVRGFSQVSQIKMEGGTYISNGTSAHGNHGGRSERLYNTQNDQGSVVGGDGSQEDIRPDVDG
jgi:hypothetical protein